MGHAEAVGVGCCCRCLTVPKSLLKQRMKTRVTLA